MKLFPSEFSTTTYTVSQSWPQKSVIAGLSTDWLLNVSTALPHDDNVCKNSKVNDAK